MRCTVLTCFPCVDNISSCCLDSLRLTCGWPHVGYKLYRMPDLLKDFWTY